VTVPLLQEWKKIWKNRPLSGQSWIWPSAWYACGRRGRRDRGTAGTAQVFWLPLCPRLSVRQASIPEEAELRRTTAGLRVFQPERILKFIKKDECEMNNNIKRFNLLVLLMFLSFLFQSCQSQNSTPINKIDNLSTITLALQRIQREGGVGSYAIFSQTNRKIILFKLLVREIFR